MAFKNPFAMPVEGKYSESSSDMREDRLSSESEKVSRFRLGKRV